MCKCQKKAQKGGLAGIKQEVKGNIEGFQCGIERFPEKISFKLVRSDFRSAISGARFFFKRAFVITFFIVLYMLSGII